MTRTRPTLNTTSKPSHTITVKYMYLPSHFITEDDYYTRAEQITTEDYRKKRACYDYTIDGQPVDTLDYTYQTQLFTLTMRTIGRKVTATSALIVDLLYIAQGMGAKELHALGGFTTNNLNYTQLVAPDYNITIIDDTDMPF